MNIKQTHSFRSRNHEVICVIRYISNFGSNQQTPWLSETVERIIMPIYFEHATIISREWPIILCFSSRSVLYYVRYTKKNSLDNNIKAFNLNTKFTSTISVYEMSDKQLLCHLDCYDKMLLFTRLPFSFIFSPLYTIQKPIYKNCPSFHAHLNINRHQLIRVECHEVYPP